MKLTKQSQHYISKALECITMLRSVRRGLEYYYLIYHGDMSKTVDYITRRLGISIKPELIKAHKDQTTFFDSNVFHSKSGTEATLYLCHKEAGKMEVLFKYPHAMLSIHTTELTTVYTFNCLSSLSLTVLKSSVTGYDDTTVNRSSKYTQLLLSHPPLVFKTYPCGCVLRSTDDGIGRCNCILVRFAAKNMFKFFRDCPYTPVQRSQHFVSSLPVFTPQTHPLILHLVDCNLLGGIPGDITMKFEETITQLSRVAQVNLEKLIHFCHIPLYSQLLNIIRCVSSSESVKEVLEYTPVNLQNEVSSIMRVFDMSLKSRFLSYNRLNILTPSRCIHMGYHYLTSSSYINDRQLQLVYLRDEGMGRVDCNNLLSEYQNKYRTVFYSLEDLLNGRFWVAQEDSDDTEIEFNARHCVNQVTEYYNHYPLYLNSSTVETLQSMGLSSCAIDSVIQSLLSAIDEAVHTVNASLQFLPIPRKHYQMAVDDIIANHPTHTECNYLLCEYTNTIVRSRLLDGLLPVMNGGTFYFKVDKSGSLKSGEIRLKTHSFTQTVPNHVVVLSPIGSAKARLFKNVCASEPPQNDNVVFFSEEDYTYFTTLNAYKPVCNCIWDDTIISSLDATMLANGNESNTAPQNLQFIPSCQYVTFLCQYTKISIERVPSRLMQAGNMMDWVLNQTTIPEESTSSYMPPRSYQYIHCMPTQTFSATNKSFNDQWRSVLFLLDTIGSFRNSARDSQVYSSWTLQLTGNVDDPLTESQLNEYLQLLNIFVQPIEQPFSAMEYYGLVYILSHCTLSINAFISTYIQQNDLDH